MWLIGRYYVIFCNKLKHVIMQYWQQKQGNVTTKANKNTLPVSIMRNFIFLSFLITDLNATSIPTEHRVPTVKECWV